MKNEKEKIHWERKAKDDERNKILFDLHGKHKQIADQTHFFF
jgi:hypothetical protein